MECTGCNRDAKYMLYDHFEPHCHSCFLDAADSTVPIKVMSIDAYENMMNSRKVVISA